MADVAAPSSASTSCRLFTSRRRHRSATSVRAKTVACPASDVSRVLAFARKTPPAVSTSFGPETARIAVERPSSLTERPLGSPNPRTKAGLLSSIPSAGPTGATSGPRARGALSCLHWSEAVAAGRAAGEAGGTRCRQSRSPSATSATGEQHMRRLSSQPSLSSRPSRALRVRGRDRWHVGTPSCCSRRDRQVRWTRRVFRGQPSLWDRCQRLGPYASRGNLPARTSTARSSRRIMTARSYSSTGPRERHGYPGISQRSCRRCSRRYRRPCTWIRMNLRSAY